MNTFFIEKQQFRIWWVWTIFLVPFIILVIGMYRQLFLNKLFGGKPFSDFLLIFITCLYSVLILFFYKIKLITEINEKGINVKFYPFFSFRYIGWEDVEKISIIRYKPIRSFGGWGIRYGRNSVVYSISGKDAIEITLKKNKLILIGTKSSKEIEQKMPQIEKFL